jgi:predicted ATPase
MARLDRLATVKSLAQLAATLGREFSYALLQDAAYQSLLKSTRQQYHQRIAQVLEAQFSEAAETQPELLAYHYTEAGLAAQAVGCWQRAGERSNARSAYVETVAHCSKGLEVL